MPGPVVHILKSLDSEGGMNSVCGIRGVIFATNVASMSNCAECRKPKEKKK